MKKLMSHTLLPALAAMVLWSVIFFPHAMPVLAQNSSAQVIEVTAKKYEYSPAPIHCETRSEDSAQDHRDRP